MSTDFQKNKVYRWEDEVVASRDKSLIPFENLQMIADYIWAEEGLKYPPMVTPMPKQNRTAWAKANRHNVYAPEEGLPTWVLIHELSHSLTSDVDQRSDRHGAKFVGIYMRLIEKHLKVPMPILIYTASKAGVKFDITARPIFKD